MWNEDLLDCKFQDYTAELEMVQGNQGQTRGGIADSRAWLNYFQ